MECIHQEGQRELDTVAVQAAAEEVRLESLVERKWFWEIQACGHTDEVWWSMMKYTWKI